jgi:putative Holliday junction resolvase
LKYLGLDLGTRTLGVSISDLTHTIASTYGTIRYEEGNYDYLISELSKIVDAEGIEKIVLGLPKNMNNTLGESAIRCIDFGKMIEERLNVLVVMQDERLTTVEATNYMLEANVSRKKRKNKIDSLAANIILQSYLDRKEG